ncbi:MAG: hypothetical protein HY954_03695 [Deltaproteobacteria bacterium]|nr:hypothetical protein [Deltaproteobacteria bacterium]
MIAAIIILIALAFVLSLVPLFIYFDLQARKGYITHPLLKGVLGGLILWFVIAVVLIIDGAYGTFGILTGESGLIFMLIFPFTIMGFIGSGMFMAKVYGKRTGPLVFKK